MATAPPIAPDSALDIAVERGTAAGLESRQETAQSCTSDGEKSDSTILSSAPSMGRQMTELSEVQCTDLMERQCQGFKSRENDYWKRQCSTPAERQNLECLEGLKRQISCPTSLTEYSVVRGMARIQDESASGSESTPFGSRQVSQAAQEVVCDGLLETAICMVVSDCNFSVSVADPTSLDCELIAVSEGFVRMTGYNREEVLGENCRFLNDGCAIAPQQRQRLAATVESGAPFVGVLVNRKKSGALFLNMLDLRGLVIARNPQTGEDIWILIGVQMDITDVDRATLPDSHLAVLNQVAGRIRKRLVKSLGEVGLSGAISNLRWNLSKAAGSRSVDSKEKGCWSLVLGSVWKPGEQPAHLAVNEIQDLALAVARDRASEEPCEELCEEVVDTEPVSKGLALGLVTPLQHEEHLQIRGKPWAIERSAVQCLAVGAFAGLGALVAIRLLRRSR